MIVSESYSDLTDFVVADFIFVTFGREIKYIADVAGGKGMLSRILAKKYNYEPTVIDPRGYPLLGVSNLESEYLSSSASYYDLVVGLHPDQATKEIAFSAVTTNTILIPCCNFWDKTKKLGRDALISEIERYYDDHRLKYSKVIFDFEGPKNIGLITYIH
jgi:hypothetical protein